MSNFDDLERQVLALPPNEKAALARSLIDDLDQTRDEDMPSVSGDEAMARARQRLR